MKECKSEVTKVIQGVGG